MVTWLVKRAVFGFVGALLMIGAVAGVQAAPVRQDASTVAGSDECVGCHEGLRGYWADSAHGHATEDTVFQESWQEQGSPPECLACHTTGYDPETNTYVDQGITCTACHYPVVGDHPDNYMPTDVSSRLCGSCHQDTHSEWESSGHGEEGMSCNNCHNAHTAELRVGSTQELCETCHTDETHNYDNTGHAQEGLLCTDCHLRVSESTLGEGHSARRHTFSVDLDTCNECHETQMHTSGEAMPGTGAFEPQAACEVSPEEPVVTDTPRPASPLAYILPAGFGLVFGALLAPWVESIYRRRKSGGE